MNMYSICHKATVFFPPNRCRPVQPGRKALTGLFLSVMVLGSFATCAQTYPTKPLRYIVPFPPGGIADIAARILAPRLTEALGQPVVVEQRLGAGGNIGAEAVAKAAPDGHTLLSAAPPVAIAQSMFRNLSFNPRRDLAPVALFGVVPNVLVVGPNSPARTVKELMDLARKNPGKLNYSSIGAGTSVHLSAELLKYQAKAFIVHIPYRGAPQAMTALLAGEVDMMLDALPPSMAQIRAGKIRALAVTTAQRSTHLPDIPTLAESGFPGYEVTSWTGMSTTNGTSAEIINRLSMEIKKALTVPEVITMFERQGMTVRYLDAREFSNFIDAEIAKFALAVKYSGAEVD
jgi:tripartite-type tricarboxylate transporter receptor subunit TctC